MFKSLIADLPKDKDLPARTFDLTVLASVLDGTLYDHLPHDFHTEKNGADEYIPLRQRRPSVRYALCRTVVDDSVSLLFSEGHFPALICADEETKRALEQVIKESRLNEVMIDAATRGSVGSVVIRLRVLNNRVFFDAMSTAYLTPTWQEMAPDMLEKVTERYKVKGHDLVAAGYSIADDSLNADHWFMREWTVDAENWYLPWLVSDEKAKPGLDADRTPAAHKLGFVPMVWVRNLPGGTDIDGMPTLTAPAINTNIEIDYLLSQAARGLKYSSDPTLLIKEPAVDAQGTMVKGAGNAITVGKDGDAKLLEINGTASDAVVAYVRFLRELALESLHGNRSNADKISAAQSGRAMELMNQALVWLADKLRISYGEGALLELLNMVVAARAKFSLTDRRGNPLPELKADATLGLRWPAWYAPTASDQQSLAIALGAHTDKGHLSVETATRIIAPVYSIEDPKAEAAAAAKEVAARNDAAQLKVNIPG